MRTLFNHFLWGRVWAGDVTFLRPASSVKNDTEADNEVYSLGLGCLSSNLCTLIPLSSLRPTTWLALYLTTLLWSVSVPSVYALDSPPSAFSILFEVTSALGVVGLSLGDGMGRSFSADFTDFGKFILIICMLLGRFGPLMIGLFALKGPSHSLYRYPQSRIVIG